MCVSMQVRGGNRGSYTPSAATIQQQSGRQLQIAMVSPGVIAEPYRQVPACLVDLARRDACVATAQRAACSQCWRRCQQPCCTG